MPIGLESATEEASQAAAQIDDAAEAGTHNPLTLTPRARAFCEVAVALSEKNKRTLTSDEFDSLSDQFSYLEGFERYAAGVELSRVGIGWMQTLDDATDGYDDELNGYSVYCSVRNAVTPTT